MSGYLFEETSLDYRKGKSWNYTLDEGNVKGRLVPRIAVKRAAAFAPGSRCRRRPSVPRPTATTTSNVATAAATVVLVR